MYYCVQLIGNNFIKHFSDNQRIKTQDSINRRTSLALKGTDSVRTNRIPTNEVLMYLEVKLS